VEWIVLYSYISFIEQEEKAYINVFG